MAWRRAGDKPLSESMMVSLLTHICVTGPQWVKVIFTLLLPCSSVCVSRVTYSIFFSTIICIQPAFIDELDEGGLVNMRKHFATGECFVSVWCSCLRNTRVVRSFRIFTFLWIVHDNRHRWYPGNHHKRLIEELCWGQMWPVHRMTVLINENRILLQSFTHNTFVGLLYRSNGAVAHNHGRGSKGCLIKDITHVYCLACDTKI